MKKFILSCLIFLTFATVGFSKEVESFITGAYSFGFFTEKAEGMVSDISSNAFDLSISPYFSDNWGLYLNTGYYFPSRVSVTSGGSKVSTTSADWDRFVIISAILGPTYKFSISDKLSLFGALGFHFAQTTMTSKYSALLNYSFGVGGDIGARYQIAPRWCLTAGTLFSRDFYSKGEATVSGYGSTAQDGKYNLGSIRPYVGVCYHIIESIK